MTTEPLQQFAEYLRARTSRMNSGATLRLYIIGCALGVLACGYVIVCGIDGRARTLHVTALTPPVMLYDAATDSIIHSHKK